MKFLFKSKKSLRMFALEIATRLNENNSDGYKAAQTLYDASAIVKYIKTGKTPTSSD